MALFCEEPSCLGLGPEWLECCQQEQSENENDARFGNLVTDEELVICYSNWYNIMNP